MTAIQSKHTGFPMDLAMQVKLAQRINPGIFADPMQGFSFQLRGIYKTEVLQAKEPNPYAAADYYVAVHFRQAMKEYRKRGTTTLEEYKIPREQKIMTSIEIIVITRDDILLSPDEIISAMKYKFHANVLLLKTYSVLSQAMDLPLDRYMTEKQKALREARRLSIFNGMKSLFKANGIWLFFVKEL
jgi:hypothetical protein